MVQKGDFLISYPYLEDDYFFRSVICMLEHNEEGSFGLIINKMMPNKIGEVMPILSHLDNPLYMGGPVETSNLFFLHPYADLKDTICVREGLYWNGDIYELKDMFELNFAQPNDVKFYLGYAGWSPKQLQDEILENSWFVGSNDLSLIYEQIEDDEIWRRAMKKLGGEHESLAQFPKDPMLN